MRKPCTAPPPREARSVDIFRLLSTSLDYRRLFAVARGIPAPPGALPPKSSVPGAHGDRDASSHIRLLLAALFLLAIAARADDGPRYVGVTPDYVNLSEQLPTSAGVPDVALDYEQNSHVVWRSGRDIYYAKSDEYGNWLLTEGAEPVPFVKVHSMTTSTFVPSIAVDFNGAAHIAAANGSAGIAYFKYGADGQKLFQKAVTIPGSSLNATFTGADVALDPSTNLPVIGSHVTLSSTVLIYAIPFQKYQDRIYALRLRNDGTVSDKILYAASGWSLGGSPGIFTPPAIAVDETGNVHAVWKTRTVNDSFTDAEGAKQEVTIDYGGGVGRTLKIDDPNASLADKYAAPNRHGVTYGKGDIMIEYSHSMKATQGLGRVLKFGGVYINTPGDIDPGTYIPVPRIAVDWKGKVHIAWPGFDGTKNAILYSRIEPNKRLDQPLNLGKIEFRSVIINSSAAEVEDEQCDLAVGDSAVHFVWCDGRNAETGMQIYHGAVPIEHAGPIASDEYPISGERETDSYWPRIAFRHDREFDKWIGYEGDTLNPGLDEFSATEADTIVNLYQGTTVTAQATYRNWPDGSASPPDPEISLDAPPDEPTPFKAHISADDGFGQYTVIWQEQMEGSAVVDVALHRRRYWAGKFGLAPRFNVLNRLWLPADATASLESSGETYVNQQIPLTPNYTELVRNSNYHDAQGMVADGVTPLVIRMDLPAGDYRYDMKGGEDGEDNLADAIQDNVLYIFDHTDGNFRKLGIADKITVRSEFAGVDPRETIFVIRGFDWTNSSFYWPLGDETPTKAQATVALRLWHQVNGEGLDMVNDPPFAIVPFGVAKPPVVLLHSFNRAASGWSGEFKKPLEDHTGGDMVFAIDYGQSMTAAGPWAEWTGFLQEVGKGVLEDTLKISQGQHPGGLDQTGSYTADQAILDYQTARSEYDKLTGELNEIKTQVNDLKGVLEDLGILPEPADGGDDGDDEGSWLDTLKTLTSWEKSSSAALTLDDLSKEVTMNLYATEELIRHKQQWAFTRYDAIGHGQGGNLLRLLANDGSKNNSMSTRFIQPRNFGRGRFRTITTIGTAHRGSRLTQYYRHYYDHAIQEIKDRLWDYASLSSAPPLENVGVGLVLMHYLSRQGYMEDKFDPCVGASDKQGEAVLLRVTHPVHPGARFHYVSTVIDFELPGVQNLFSCIGLIRPGPKVPPSFGLFETVFPTAPKPPGAPDRYIDGLVDWRSHLAWLDYTNAANAKYVTHLDALTGTYKDQYAAHVPPFSTKAVLGIEDPGPPGWKDVYDLIKSTVEQDWKAVLSTIATEMVKRWFKDNDVLFSPFGTLNTQTNMALMGEEMANLLAAPVPEHFTPHIDYDPGATGNGNPEAGLPEWGTLVQQDNRIGNAVRLKIAYVFNQADANFANAFVKALENLRAPTEPGVYHYQLTPPEDLPRDPAYDVIWSTSVLNQVVANSQGVQVEVDPADDTKVTITVDPEVYGTVVLNCSYFSTDGRLVRISPVVIARMNMSEMTGLHIGTLVPALPEGDSVYLVLEAEYEDGFYGALIPDPSVPQSWASSDEEIATVSHGLVTAGNKAGKAQITATYGDFSTTATVTVVGELPTVAMTAPLDGNGLVGGDTVELRAGAEDPDGTVSAVYFFANDAPLASGTPNAGEYAYTWPDLAPGEYEVYAVAVDDDDDFQVSESIFLSVANRPPVMDAWPLPVADQWYGGNVFLQAEAGDPDGDPISVQFEYSLDSTDGENGSWSQCYYPLTAAPYDCEWASFPDDGLDDVVWLRVRATDDSGDTSGYMTRRIKIDNSAAGITFAPHPGETGIALDVRPTLTFDNPVTQSNDAPITDGDLAGLISFTRQGTPVPFTATINPAKTVITLVPGALLDGVTPYTVSLVDDIKDGVTGDLFRRTGATFVTTFGEPVGIEFRNVVFSGEAGAVLDSAVLVNVVDAQSNTVTDSTAAITLSLGSRAVLDGTLTVSAVDGVALFDDLSMTEAGTFTLSATAPGLGGDTSPALTIRPSALGELTLSTSADTAAAGERLSATVSAYDRFGNLKTDYRGTPNFITGDQAASLPPFYTFYETDRGVHTYRNTVVFRTLGAQTLRVRDHDVYSDTVTVTVTNTPPDAPQLLSPVHGGFSGLAPICTFSPFQDTDNAQHAGSHIQVADDAEFANVVWDSGELGPVTGVQLPDAILAEFTAYHWRARVRDDSGDAATEWSEWSAPASFTTGYALPFVDPFSTNRGWTGLAEDRWEIGPATAGGGEEYGNPDPDTDTTPGNDDNGVLGYNIGGNYEENADSAVTSPPLDCSDAAIVELSFQRWLGVEGNDWGHASIRVSSDNEEWHQVWANPQTDVTDDQWQALTYDITPWAAGQPTVWVRYDMGPMRASYPFCGWNIDDVTVGTAAEELAEIILEIPEQDIHVGEYFHFNIYLQENHPDADGIMGAAFDIDMTGGMFAWAGPWYVHDTMSNPPWDADRRSEGFAGGAIRNYGALTSQTGLGNGEPVLLGSIRLRADRAGTADFTVTPVAGFALASPVGQIGTWRVQARTLTREILPPVQAPLALLRLEGPAMPVALGNDFEVNVYVREDSPQASGFLGGPFDLYFDHALVSCPAFSPDTAIQPPYTDIGLLSGVLLDNRIDELGGATLDTGHGNGSEKLYAILTFRADAIGITGFKAEPGSAGFALTTPVGQLDTVHIDYGAEIAVDIRQNYTLTVNSGTVNVGNGNYVEGKVVPISADPPATGMAFSHWEGDTQHLADANSADTDATMPAADVEVTAVYVPVNYILTVDSGTGSTPAAHYQDVIPIAAHPAATGQLFDRWQGETAHLADPNAESTDVTMPAANVTVAATYRNILYTLSVDNGSGDKADAIYQEQIAVSADTAPTGFEFSQWTGDISYVENVNSPNTKVTMPAGNVTVAAVYSAIDYTLTVTGGTGSTSVANYQDVLPISADPPATGHAFAGWTGDTAFLVDPMASDTDVTMPAQHVALAATYTPIPYTLLVVNGTGSGTYHYGDVVGIVADDPAQGGAAFSGWVGHTDRLADPGVATTNVNMPDAHVALVAVYGSQIGGTADINLTVGWNCFSVPFQTDSPEGKPEFADMITGHLWRWDGTNLVPVGTDARGGGKLEPEYGYWVYSPTGGLMQLTPAAGD